MLEIVSIDYITINNLRFHLIKFNNNKFYLPGIELSSYFYMKCFNLYRCLRNNKQIVVETFSKSIVKNLNKLEKIYTTVPSKCVLILLNKDLIPVIKHYVEYSQERKYKLYEKEAPNILLSFKNKKYY